MLLGGQFKKQPDTTLGRGPRPNLGRSAAPQPSGPNERVAVPKTFYMITLAGPSFSGDTACIRAFYIMHVAGVHFPLSTRPPIMPYDLAVPRSWIVCLPLVMLCYFTSQLDRALVFWWSGGTRSCPSGSLSCRPSVFALLRS